ncbi:MAG: FGGY family carbohydrate kinase [Candidatus Hermodarchaeota archaeon]
MLNSENKILVIDISSNKIKVGLVSEDLKLGSTINQNLTIINEDVDGFAKRFDMNDMWNKLKKSIYELLNEQYKSKRINIIGISSCAQRMAVVFLDNKGDTIYGGPNIDVRGIDSAYLIEDQFSEEELFQITGHSPSILFCLARLLWFKEEQEHYYNKIGKVLMLDDWIIYKLTGEFCTDLSSAGESQMVDIEKENWSLDIIEAFDFNPDLFPEFIDSGMIAGDLLPELISYFNFNQKSIPVIKSGGDTQATLLGMGVINDGNIGISLGSTAPIHLVVNKPILDPNCNFWTTFHSIKGKWLIEGNSGNTGIVYDWLKDYFLFTEGVDKNELIENLIQEIKPGSDSTFAFLGPELMNIKDQTLLKRGVFVFPPPTLITEKLPKFGNFLRSGIENIGFGINENFIELKKYTQSEIRTFSAGGMSKSTEFCKILTNILDQKLIIPQFKDSAFLGCAMNTLIGLNKYPNYKKLIDDLIEFEEFLVDKKISDEYKKVYNQWKNLKKHLSKL